MPASCREASALCHEHLRRAVVLYAELCQTARHAPSSPHHACVPARPPTPPQAAHARDCSRARAGTKPHALAFLTNWECRLEVLLAAASGE
jgi:hypothetical protein